MSGIDLDSIRTRLRQLDFLSGFIGLAPRGDFDAICEDLAINEVAGLIHEIANLRAENAAMREVCDTSVKYMEAADASEDDGEDEATQDAGFAWDKAVRRWRAVQWKSQHAQQGPVSAIPAVTPAGPPSASPQVEQTD